MKTVSAILAFGLALIVLSPAQADIVTIDAVADSFIMVDRPTNNAGGHTHAAVGSNSASNARRGLFRFNVASMVPINANISSVRFEFDVSQSGGTAHAFELYRATQSWGEGNNVGNNGSAADNDEVTWNDRFHNNASWTSAGGDFSASMASSTNVNGAGTYSFNSSAQFVADVQDMLDNSAGDFGFFMLAADEATASTALRVGTREGGTPARLIVEFTPIPEPASAGLLLMLGGLVLRRRK